LVAGAWFELTTFLSFYEEPSPTRSLPYFRHKKRHVFRHTFNYYVGSGGQIDSKQPVGCFAPAGIAASGSMVIATQSLN